MTKEQLQTWLRGLGCPDGVRFEAPGGGWVRLRPLTWRESLQREALACTEEFELESGGGVRRVVRRFDAEEARRYDLAHCVIEWGGQSPKSEVQSQGGGGDPLSSSRADALDATLPRAAGESLGRFKDELAERLLAELGPELARWLEECLDEINLRRPADREALAEVKKS
jgi:hypothetical protein